MEYHRTILKTGLEYLQTILLNEKSKMQNRVYIMLLLVFLKRVIYG